MNLQIQIIKILKIFQSKQLRNRERQAIIIKELQFLKECTEINIHYNKENCKFLTSQINSVRTSGYHDLATRIEKAVADQQETIVRYEEIIRANREIIMDTLKDERQDENYVNEKIENWIKTNTNKK